MTTIRALALSFLVVWASLYAPLASAQNAALLPVPRPQFLDTNGAPLVGGYLYTCTAGTTCLPAFVGDPPVNPLATFTDSSGSVANANPIVLDSAGRAGVWLGSGNYKLVLQDANGVTQWSQDNVSSLSLKSVTTSSGAVSNFNVPGTLTVGGAATVTGAVTAQSVNAVLNAAQYTGSNMGAKINAAMAACPSTGCEIDIPAGSYTLTTQVVVNKANVRLHGAGSSATTLVQGFTGDLIAVTANYATIDGFTLNGAGFSVGWSLIHGTSSNYGSVYNNVLTDSRSPAFNTLIGIRVEGNSTTAAANYWNIHDNSFVSIPWIGVSLANNSNHNRIHDNSLINGGEAFDFNGVGTGAAIVGNVFDHNHVVGGFGDSFLESAAGSSVTNNDFDFSTASTSTLPIIAVHLAASGSQSRTIISGNQFRGGAGSANCLYVYDNAIETLITGNVFDSCGYNGIFVTTGAGSVTNLNITNNIFHNSGVSNAASAFSAIQVSQVSGNAIANWIVSGNFAYDDQSPKSQTYGFAVTGSGAVFNSYIHDNDFSNNKTGAFSFSGGASLHSSTVVGPNRETTGGTLVFETPVQARVSSFPGTPTVVCGAVAGTCTVSVAGTDQRGNISLTTGTTAVSSGGVIATLTFSTPFSSAAYCSLSSTGPFAATYMSAVYKSATSTALQLLNNGAPFPSSTSFTWTYTCGN